MGGRWWVVVPPPPPTTYNPQPAAMDTLIQDIRYAVRGLFRSPGFTFAVVLTLALGIGANTTMFGVLDALLLKAPAGVRDASRVARVYFRMSGVIGPMAGRAVSGMAYPAYEALRRVRGLCDVAAFTDGQVSLGTGAEARPARIRAVTSSYFPLLGAHPALGRFFDSTEDQLGAGPVAVVSHTYWMRQLGGDPDVLRQTLAIGSSVYAIVGVAPLGFAGAELDEPDVWLPIRQAAPLLAGADALSSWKWVWVQALVRLAPGATTASAAAEATVVVQRAAAAAAPSQGASPRARNEGIERVLLGPIQAARGPEMADDAKVAMWVGAVALVVLLVACANVGNLLLSRAPPAPHRDGGARGTGSGPGGAGAPAPGRERGARHGRWSCGARGGGVGRRGRAGVPAPEPQLGRSGPRFTRPRLHGADRPRDRCAGGPRARLAGEPRRHLGRAQEQRAGCHADPRPAALDAAGDAGGAHAGAAGGRRPVRPQPAPRPDAGLRTGRGSPHARQRAGARQQRLHFPFVVRALSRGAGGPPERTSAADAREDPRQSGRGGRRRDGRYAVPVGAHDVHPRVGTRYPAAPRGRRAVRHGRDAHLFLDRGHAHRAGARLHRRRRRRAPRRSRWWTSRSPRSPGPTGTRSGNASSSAWAARRPASRSSASPPTSRAAP